VSEVPFYQTKIGRQYYDVTLPNLVREIHRLNDMLGLAVELMEAKTPKEDSPKPDPGEKS